MPATVLCVAAHPDDIEFMMAGTLLLLGQAGCTLHMLNVANGCCGTAELDRETIAALRLEEARAAARLAGATLHPPLCDDIAIFYEPRLLARLGALVREVNPQIVLLPSPQDYMEDHSNTSRLMVTAAFCRGMRNFATEPQRAPVEGPCALYHALPYGLHDQLRQPIQPDFYVDVHEVIEPKRAMLACHRSQGDWLDHSQGPGSYLAALDAMSREVGRMAGGLEHAEGWRRHLHLGFATPDFDPLASILAQRLRPHHQQGQTQP